MLLNCWKIVFVKTEASQAVTLELRQLLLLHFDSKTNEVKSRSTKGISCRTIGGLKRKQLLISRLYTWGLGRRSHTKKDYRTFTFMQATDHLFYWLPISFRKQREPWIRGTRGYQNVCTKRHLEMIWVCKQYSNLICTLHFTFIFAV